MEEDEEVDILGEDTLTSNNERAISYISAGQILSCDYTVHPRWLADNSDATELWPENFPKQSSQDEMEMVQDEVVIEEPAPIDLDWCEETSNCGDLILEKDIPTMLEEEVVVANPENLNSDKEDLLYSPNPRSLLKSNVTKQQRTKSSKFTKRLFIDRSLLRNNRYLNIQKQNKSSRSHSPPIESRQKLKYNRKCTTDNAEKKHLRKPAENSNDKRIKKSERKIKHILFKKRDKVNHNNTRLNSSGKLSQSGKGKGKSPNKRFVDLHGENITINHDMDFNQAKKSENISIEQTYVQHPTQSIDSDQEIDIESDIMPKLEELLPPKPSSSSNFIDSLIKVKKEKEEPNNEKKDTKFKLKNESIDIELTMPIEIKSIMENPNHPQDELCLDEDDITDIEKFFHAEFFAGRPTKTPERYMKIRSYILNAWNDTRPAYIKKTTVRNGLKNCGDVNCIGRIHMLLEQIGAINFGYNGVHFNYIRPLVELYKTFLHPIQNKQQFDIFSSSNGKKDREKRVKRNSDNGKVVDANYTVSHDNFIPLVMLPASSDRSTYEIESKYIKPEFQLIQCQRFQRGHVAPFKITIHMSTLLCMQLHALSASNEVMGFIGGQRIKSNGRGRNKLNITRYKPCKTSKQNGTMCEMCPVSQVEQSSSLVAEGNELLGWFHSHPTFPPNPSRTDVRTQEEMQHQFSYDIERPFVGFILGCIDMSLKCMYILPEDLHNIEAECIPYEMDVDIVNNFSSFMNEIQDILTVVDRKADTYPTIIQKFICSSTKLFEKFGYEKDTIKYVKNILE